MKRTDRATGAEPALERRLAAYGAMSVALTAIAMPQAAQANSIAWDAGITTTPSTPIYFNLNLPNASVGWPYVGSTPGSNTFELWTDVESLVSKARFVVNSNSHLFFAVSNGSVARLPHSATIGSQAGLTFAQGYNTLAANTNANSLNPFGNWNAGGEGIVGLEVILSGNTHYGWADISVNPDTYVITLNSFGVNDTPGQAAQTDTSPEPEPASIVLLCLGAAGMAAYRRKKSRA